MPAIETKFLHPGGARRTWEDEQYRQDTCNAINLCLWKGMLGVRPFTDPFDSRSYQPEFHFGLVYATTGKAMVLFWLCFPEGHQLANHEIPNSRQMVDPVDLITAAGPLSLVRGISDSL